MSLPPLSLPTVLYIFPACEGKRKGAKPCSSRLAAAAESSSSVYADVDWVERRPPMTWIFLMGREGEGADWRWWSHLCPPCMGGIGGQKSVGRSDSICYEGTYEFHKVSNGGKMYCTNISCQSNAKTLPRPSIVCLDFQVPNFMKPASKVQKSCALSSPSPRCSRARPLNVGGIFPLLLLQHHRRRRYRHQGSPAEEEKENRGIRIDPFLPRPRLIAWALSLSGQGCIKPNKRLRDKTFNSDWAFKRRSRRYAI